MNKTVEQHIPLVEYIAQVIGPNCEVILHDLEDLEHSVVAVSQNSLTGRKIGDAITDVALMLLHNKSYMEQSFVVNYEGKVKGSSATFRSSTYFIREAERIVGLLCINVDVSAYVQVREMMDSMLLMNRLLPDGEPAEKMVETFTVSGETLLQKSLETVSGMFQVPPEHLKMDEKRRFVRELYDRGCFTLKGSVVTVSEWLQISESSVYRYLRECMREKKPV